MYNLPMKIKVKNFYPRTAILIGTILLLLVGFFVFKEKIQKKTTTLAKSVSTKILKPTIVPMPTLIVAITPSASATPTPISFEDMNKNYGPCAKVAVLMYHHIENADVAKQKNQGSLNVTPEFLQKDLQYLKDKNYNVIGMGDLKNFFDNGIGLPKKSVLLTFDDGYKDNYENMYPILKQFGYKATIFIPTGLLNNPDYLTWDDLNSMKDLVYFGNHTWSHHSSGGTEEKQDQEIGLADQQLADHGYNQFKIFAYPYGKPSGNSEEVLKNKNYEIAFTTTHGSTLCKGKSLELPRIRIGDAPLSSYGL
jgi:peptidoglycan/xylan/chitin deacetylase (PgdA/CDA1 family)